jgi:hypothetical protein
VRRDPAPVAWALAALVLLGTLVAGAGPQAPTTLAPTALPTTRLVTLGEAEGQLGEGDAWVGQVPVRALALREVVALLTWEDDAPGTSPDAFTLELVPPAGMEAGPVAEGAGGSLEIRVPVYRTAPPQRVEWGLGDWSLRVYLRSAGDGSTLGLAPGMPDEGNAFHLQVTATAWHR